MIKRNRPSFGRKKSERGFDQFDTPPEALVPLFVHEPLLQGVTSICEPFCGQGNLVVPMRLRGIKVYASDIQYRGCPDSIELDFLKMPCRPPDCDVLLSNPAFSGAMGFIEHALKLEFRVVILLLKLTFLSTIERRERLHKPGHLRRVHIITERVQGMHDAAHVAAGGKIASQSQDHGWFVLDRNYRGPSMNHSISMKRPFERMPWASEDQLVQLAEAAE
jgi:hypothetical protein